MSLSRRTFLGASLTFPSLIYLPSLPLIASSCGKREPETPLAHLYGRQWVHGAYEMYAGKYVSLQNHAETTSQQAYAVLAQKGIVALEALQSREVPFHIHVDRDRKGFEVERNLPERLTFNADMTDADRHAATANWSKAREHIHTDYSEIRRLNWALTSLFGQLQRIRSAVDNGRIEQYRLARQLSALTEGSLPFALPYQVTLQDYEKVLYLLVERIDNDRARLQGVEASIISVGLTARATDAGSGSLAGNLHQVLLAVVQDSEASRPRPADFPKDSDKHDGQLSKGKELSDAIRKSPEYAAWLKQEREKELQQVGFLLSIFDKVTGLDTSTAFRQVVDIFSGDADYLTYLRVVAGLVPGGGLVSKALNQAVEITAMVRDVTKKIETGVKTADAVVSATKDKGVVNAGSQYARSRLNKQLIYYKDQAEATGVAESLKATELMKSALPQI
jgi:hypothetical protein